MARRPCDESDLRQGDRGPAEEAHPGSGHLSHRPPLCRHRNHGPHLDVADSRPLRHRVPSAEGRHLQVLFKVSSDPRLLATTPATIGASAFGGPYPSTTLQFKYRDPSFYMATFALASPRAHAH